MTPKLLEQFLIWVHGLSGAAWFGAIFYRTLVVDGKALAFFEKRGEYERFSTHLAHNMRYFVSAGLLTCGLSGFALLGLMWDGQSGAWLVLMAAKAGVWLAAGGLFTYVSWVHWPWRALAAPEEFPQYRKQGQRLAVGMVVLAGAGFALGQASRMLVGIAPFRSLFDSTPPARDVRAHRSLPSLVIFLGWLLFGIALVCPAIRVVASILPGWQCLLVTLCWFPMWVAWKMMILGVANLLLIGSVLVYCWESGLERTVYGLFLLLAAVAALAVTFPIFPDEACVGAYLWLGSLFVTSGGFLLATHAQSPT